MAVTIKMAGNQAPVHSVGFSSMSNLVEQAPPNNGPEVAGSPARTNPFHGLISNEDAKMIHKMATGQEADILGYFLRPFSEGKIGFLASHQRLCVHSRSRSSGERDTVCFFVKAIPYDMPAQAEYVINKGVFEQEYIFYKQIVPQLCHGYHGRPFTAKCFLVKREFLVFEDLGLRGYKTRDKLFNEQMVKAGLECLARLHGSSIIAESRIGRSFKVVYPDSFREKGFCKDGGSERWFDAGLRAAIAIGRKLGHDLDPDLVTEAFQSVYRCVESSRTKRNVVSHGDLWANNLMFSDDLEDCLLVDFQLFRYAPIGHDLAQFLYLCTDRKFRRRYEHEMIRYYYDVLQRTLREDVGAEVPSWSEVMAGFEEQRLGAVVTAVLYFPMVLMEENLAAKFMNDPDKYSEYSFESRDEIVWEVMNKDRVYGRRIGEVIEELLELCQRLDRLPKPS